MKRSISEEQETNKKQKIDLLDSLHKSQRDMRHNLRDLRKETIKISEMSVAMTEQITVIIDKTKATERLIELVKQLQEKYPVQEPHQSVSNSPNEQQSISDEVMKDFVNPKYEPEPLLMEESTQLTFYPITHDAVFQMLKKMEASFWVADEVDLSGDPADWEHKTTTDEKFFLSHIIGFFAASDGLVNFNIIGRFLNEVKNSEVRNVYTFQAAIEVIHGEMYSLLLDTYIKDPTLRQLYLNSVVNIPCIKKKAEWSQKWIDSDKTFNHRLIANAIIEGIFFSGAFCAIYWFGTKNLLHGLLKSNKFIARDEGMHTMTACLIYSMLKNKLKESVVFEIIDEAVVIEKEFICESLSCELLGMNSKLMCTYIEYVADTLLINLGYGKKYGSANPFPHMEKIGLNSVTNFFEHRPTEYSKNIQDKEAHEIDDAIKHAVCGDIFE